MPRGRARGLTHVAGSGGGRLGRTDSARGASPGAHRVWGWGAVVDDASLKVEGVPWGPGASPGRNARRPFPPSCSPRLGLSKGIDPSCRGRPALWLDLKKFPHSCFGRRLVEAGGTFRSELSARVWRCQWRGRYLGRAGTWPGLGAPAGCGRPPVQGDVAGKEGLQREQLVALTSR